MRPAVSVVVPVLDMADSIGACLDALVSQSLPESEREILVVDNGSTDGTLDVIRRYPVRLLEEPAAGAPNARNRGASEARGALVAFTDADCVASRHWLRHLVAAAREPGVDVVAGSMAVLNPDQSIIARYSAMLRQYDAERALAHPRHSYAPTANLLFNRRRLIDGGLYNPAFPTFDAAELFWRLRRQGPLSVRQERRAVVFYRTRSSIRAFVRQNYGYGAGVGRYCRLVARHEADVPGAWSLLRYSGRRLGSVGQLARASAPLSVRTRLIGLHLIREVAMAAGTMVATVGPRA